MADVGEPAEAWTSVLDQYESAMSGAVADELDDVAPFVPPIGLGPIPEHLVARATALLEESRRMEQSLADRVAKTADELGSLSRSSRVSTPENRAPRAKYFDASI